MIIPQREIIKTINIPQDANYKGLRIVHYQTDTQAQSNWDSNSFQFQHEPADYTVLRAIVSLKGAPPSYRLVATVHPTMKQFVDIVKYDPYDPPIDNYDAQGMKEAHERTQSDFKGQKKQNLNDFKNYIIEGISGVRTLFLPTISGWQSSITFDKTVFVAFDESDPLSIYGLLYLPKTPIMQSDGQTQTAAIFQAAKTVDAIKAGALDTLTVTLEVELNVSEQEAGQSFADRNGRGSKKNKNLVIVLDNSSALSTLRVKALSGSIFENRLADGRTTGTSETATKNIVDLSTMEQMLLNVISNGKLKTEHFKHHYIEWFLPYCQEFIKILEDNFGHEWLENTPKDKDPFRRLYVHGWPFALKAIAKAYHHARIEQIGPLLAAIGTERENKDANLSVAEKYKSQVEIKKAESKFKAPISLAELNDRLSKINWLRYKKHWISLTGYAIKSGQKKTFTLTETGEQKVSALAQNTPSRIDSVTSKILSNSWTDLCGEADEPLN
ncbi:DNA sulfur modification protein DndB [Bacillus infantis]|uniref:DNA sulfur modification protein DndB n=1 Tax=Bacillus infantis TaxID=324767 RepID=UPI003CF049D8